MRVIPVTTDEFLSEIKIAQRWTMGFINGELQLSIMEHGEWAKVFAPDLSGMGKMEVQAFMEQVEKVANHPNNQSQRVA